MPSFTDKKCAGTVRLHFRRRQAAESFNLVILKASNLVIDVDTTSDGSGTTVHCLRVNPKALSMVAELLKTNQVALIINANSDLEHTFVKDVLIERAKVNVDAIYGFDLVEPSKYLLDVTQILRDFHLLSEYHKRTFGVSEQFGAFQFVEVGSEIE